jgi:hypothetical protein
MIGNVYDSMQKPAFVFDGRNILNGPALKKSDCVSKYRFLGSHPASTKEREGAEAKRGLLIISENYGLHLHKRYTVDDETTKMLNKEQGTEKYIVNHLSLAVKLKT